jgi:hypothetical protein
MTADAIEPADKDMTARAAEAFALYEAMGPARSIEKLADAEPALNVTQLKRWSKSYGWQERLRRIATANVERANEIRLAPSGFAPSASMTPRRKMARSRSCRSEKSIAFMTAYDRPKLARLLRAVQALSW